MAGSACAAKKIGCCSKQKAQSQDVGDTLDGWFANPAIAEKLESEEYAALMERVFNLVDDSTNEMQRAQGVIAEIMEKLQTDL